VTASAKPLIAVTMGDPAGIGAEVIVKALSDPHLRRSARFCIYGLNELMEYAADRAEISPFWFHVPHDEVGAVESGVVLADYDEYALLSAGLSRPTAECGHASMRFVDDATAAVAAGHADGLVTGPIHKTSWRMAGYRYPGHTERLASIANTKRFNMMFAGGKLRVALATVHEPLFAVQNTFTLGTVFQPIDLLAQALREWFGIQDPRIAVAGLNPHAGENGILGDEEARVIEPAMVMAREAGIQVEGPFPADTLFHRALTSRCYDGIVAMYHDQGLIPVKMHAFDQAVNLTLGLPFIRTSPSHGTAFDIVGRNVASAGSMSAALRMAVDLAVARRTAQAHPTSSAITARS
jgi:4-hydroxythreonine-4-phosphate dehydrogenase